MRVTHACSAGFGRGSSATKKGGHNEMTPRALARDRPASHHAAYQQKGVMRSVLGDSPPPQFCKDEPSEDAEGLDYLQVREGGASWHAVIF